MWCTMNSRYSLNKTKYLLDPEYDKLIYLLKSHIENDRRNCVLLLLALNIGARAQELLNIRWSDINEYDQTVFIKGIKNSNDRELPLPDWLFRELLKIKSSPGKPPKLGGAQLKISPQLVFPITYNRLRQIWELYRPVNKKFHALRHTFAIRIYKKTKDIRLLQVALGHRNITNTMIYADYVYSQQELKKLIL